MADVIESGPDPDRGRSRRGLVLAAVVVLAVGGYVVLDRTSEQGPMQVARPVTTSPPSPSGGTEDLPTLDLAEADGPQGLEVVIDGTNPGTVDFGQSEFEPVGGLTLTADQFTTVLPIEDAFLVVVRNPEMGVSGAAYVVRDGVATPFMDPVDVLLPAVDGDLIAVTYHYGETSTADLVGIGMDGVPRWQRTVGDQYVVGDTPFGLLVNLPNSAGDWVTQLVDPPTGVVLRSFDDADYTVGFDSTRLAWMGPDCGIEQGTCSLHVSDLETGKTRAYPAFGPQSPTTGAFSPDGTKLALSFAGMHEFDPAGHGEGGFVGMLDLSAGTLVRMAGLATGAKQNATIAWAGADQLVLAVQWPDYVRLAVWSPATEQAVALPMRVPQPMGYVSAIHVVAES